LETKIKISKKAEYIEIYSNQTSREKFYLLFDNLNFTFLGSGNLHVIFGETDIMGYKINSEKNKDDFDFDLNKNFFLFKNFNTGIYFDKNNFNIVKEEYEKIFNANKNLKNSMIKHSLLNLEQYFNRNITFLYFKNLSEDFKFIGLNSSQQAICNKKMQSKVKCESNFSYTKEKKINIEEERKFIENLEIIDTKKFAENIDLNLNILKSNKKFNIFGKKNSGKSTFLIFFINSFLSNLHQNFNENCNLFLLECDSGQPLISCPYCVSLFEIKRPIFMNFFRHNIYSKLDLTKKIQVTLKDTNFNFSTSSFEKFPIENKLNNKIDESSDLEKSFSSEEENQIKEFNLTEYINSQHSHKSIELIRSIFVDDNSPANNFEVYLSAVKNLCNLFNTINNFSVERLSKEMKNQTSNNRRDGFNIKNINYIRENLKNYLIVNSNGYTSGIGHAINSSINELLEPDYIYFIKNLKSGRVEKGEEFENLILNNEINFDNNIITRKYKLYEDDPKGILYNYKRLEKSTILIENNFKLKENENLYKKNFNRIYHIIANLIGDYNFDSANECKNKQFKNNENEFPLISFEEIKIDINFYDLLFKKGFCENYLTEISFDDLLISFDFSLFEPLNELDVLMALNGKMCSILLNENNIFCTNLQERNSVNKRNLEENYNFNNEFVNIKNFNNFSVVDSKNLKDKLFKCFSFVYNIDIINKKFVLFSKQLKSEKKIFHFISKNKISDKNNSYNEQNESQMKKIEIILFRNPNLDKVLFDPLILKENKKNINEKPYNFHYENLLINSKFDFSNIKENNLNEDNDYENNNRDPNNENFYMTRNKYNII